MREIRTLRAMWRALETGSSHKIYAPALDPTGTGTFAAVYWITKGMTAAEAIMHVRKARRHAVETPEQEAVLVEFASRMQRRS